MPILLVPLDDRPCNRLFPQRLAAIAGVDLRLPPRSLLGRFLQPGDPDGIFEWLDANSGGASALILSTDMLLYGGLIASRSPTTEPTAAARRLDRLGRLRAACPSIPIFAWAVLPRLTITSSDPWTLRWSGVVLQYTTRLAAAHQSDEDAAAECRSLAGKIPPEMLDGYFHARQRNHRLHLALIDQLADGSLDFLALSQEDAGPEGIHREDQAVLEDRIAARGVSDRARIYPGADEVALVLLARAVVAASGPGPCPVSPQFWPQSSAGRIPPYEDRPLKVSLPAQIHAAGGCLAENGAGSLIAAAPSGDSGAGQGRAARLVVYSGEVESEGQGRGDSFAAWLQGALDRGELLAIADVAAPNGADARLVAGLSEERLLCRLAAFAGWNTAGNSIGTALAHSLCLDCASSQPESPRPLAHYRFLFERLIDDWGYQSVVRPALNEELQQRGFCPLNLGAYKAEVETEVRRRLTPIVERLFIDQFQGVSCSAGVIRDLEAVEISLPWPRTFEVEISARFYCESP